MALWQKSDSQLVINLNCHPMPTKPGILNKCEATIIHLSLCWPRYCASQVCNKGARWEDTSCSLPLLLSTFPSFVPSARCVARVLSGKTPAVPYHYCTTFLSCCSNSQVCSKDVQWEDICCALPLLLSTFLSCCSNSQVCHKGAQWWDIGCSLPLLFKCYLPLTN